MSDIKLDETGDLDMSEGMEMVTGDELVAQRLHITLQTIKGTDIYFPEHGVEYFDDKIFGAIPTAGNINPYLLPPILDTEGVLGFNGAPQYEFDRNTRKLTMTAKVITDNGGTIDLQETF